MDRISVVNQDEIIIKKNQYKTSIGKKIKDPRPWRPQYLNKVDGTHPPLKRPVLFVPRDSLWLRFLDSGPLTEESNYLWLYFF